MHLLAQNSIIILNEPQHEFNMGGTVRAMRELLARAMPTSSEITSLQAMLRKVQQRLKGKMET